jgi:hypothetical protein
MEADLMIDSTCESLLTLAQAADELPRRRRGKKTHLSTLYRWATAGCRGIRLETIQIGATRCTSREALQRYFEALSEPVLSRADHLRDASPSPVYRSLSRRLRDSERAGKLLEEQGA